MLLGYRDGLARPASWVLAETQRWFGVPEWALATFLVVGSIKAHPWLAFVPLEDGLQVKGKLVIDGLVGRFGRASSSVIAIALTSLPWVAAVVGVCTAVWVRATLSVGQFIDQDVEDGATYFYKLEQVDFDGTKKMHGPVTVSVGKETAVKPSTWGLIKALLK